MTSAVGRGRGPHSDGEGDVDDAVGHRVSQVSHPCDSTPVRPELRAGWGRDHRDRRLASKTFTPDDPGVEATPDGRDLFKPEREGVVGEDVSAPNLETGERDDGDSEVAGLEVSCEKAESSSASDDAGQNFLSSVVTATQTDLAVENRPYPCDFCDYAAKSRTTINLHVRRVHLDERNFSCPYCTHSAKQKSALDLHIRAVHEEDRSFQCHLCDFNTAYKHVLQKHIRNRHENEKGAQCAFCEYKTFSPGNLKVHVERVHFKVQPEKKFVCEVCSYASSRSIRMREHMVARHGWTSDPMAPDVKDKSFACNFCDFSTMYKNSLQNHVRNKHFQEKNAECPHCDYKTYSQCNLKIHIERIHLKVRPPSKYSCRLCDFSSARQHRLRQHLIDKHGLLVNDIVDWNANDMLPEGAAPLRPRDHSKTHGESPDWVVSPFNFVGIPTPTVEYQGKHDSLRQAIVAFNQLCEKTQDLIPIKQEMCREADEEEELAGDPFHAEGGGEDGVIAQSHAADDILIKSEFPPLSF